MADTYKSYNKILGGKNIFHYIQKSNTEYDQPQKERTVALYCNGCNKFHPIKRKLTLIVCACMWELMRPRMLVCSSSYLALILGCDETQMWSFRCGN